MSTMRAKVKVSNVEKFVSGSTTKIESTTTMEKLTFNAACKNGYDSSGKDEDNSYALWTPTAEFKMSITNPSLFDKFELNQMYYVDFTLVE